ncbi:MAG TPA: hypothetical protein VIT20_10655 [Propionibacteriaceae bacterium]
MPTDWDWFWSSEAGRDRMLRGEIEGLQASAHAASSRSARLSSQLAQLQGSIETRLTALSAAFDAYVELGDVREQLAGYPDTSAIRRDAVTAIDVLSRGGRPEPLDDRGLDYWLSHAVNAVAALVARGGDPDAERRAVELSPDAELFIVAAAGALGVGTSVAGRAPALLTCDGRLSGPQTAIWDAVLAGVFGDCLADVRPVWSGAIDLGEAGWTAWVRRSSQTTGGLAALEWIDRQTVSPAPQDPPPHDGAEVASVSDPRTGLRTVVITLVGQGTGDEAALLARSRVLRARIEDPTANEVEAEPDAPTAEVTEAVREALLSAPVGSPARRELVSWVAPGLRAAVAVFTGEAQHFGPAEVEVRTDAGVITVTETGAAPQRTQQAEAYLQELNLSPRSRIMVPAVIAGVLAVLALVVTVTVGARGGLVLGLAAVVAAGVTAYMVYDARNARSRAERMTSELRAQLHEGQQGAIAVRKAQRETSTAAAALGARLDRRLGGSTDQA